jgi:DUF1680 family protein
MKELFSNQVILNDQFWTRRSQVNSEYAIFHQWKMLEESHCIDNFRIVAGEKEGFREGWFFADSDAYKWLDAASRIYEINPSIRLKSLIDSFISLLGRTQMEDGYIFTYNQVHFPTERWENLMIEHELYCHGHLIEACISNFQATGDKRVLEIACRTANLLVKEFLVATPDRTSGHVEIEIALMRLYQVTGLGHYLELARQFLERRGKIQPFFSLILRQNSSANRRAQFVQEKRNYYLSNNPEQVPFRLPADNYAKKARASKIRWQLSALTGRYFQMHAPIRKQTIPVGHAVRFSYLETAIAMLHRLDFDESLLPALLKAWDRMVNRRMYITGGIGSLPGLEGFGNDFELDPEIAYAETCAALGSLFWNWEMALISKEARFSDLFEWQLYNAAFVGMGLEGDTYLYNNPLMSRGRLVRRNWFMVPCCPSNLSRILASLGKYIFSSEKKELWIHQYIGCQTEVDLDPPVKITLTSGLPWDGKIQIIFDPVTDLEFTLHLRIPSWSKSITLHINGKPFQIQHHSPIMNEEIPASGYNPNLAEFLPITRIWYPGDVLDVEFQMPVTIRRASPNLPGHKNKVALSRGPVVYCLESQDNPGIDVINTTLDLSSVNNNQCVYFKPDLLGGTKVITGKSVDDRNLTLIPYFLWANRGESQMTVWVNCC